MSQSEMVEKIAEQVYDWIHESQVTHRKGYQNIEERFKESYRILARAVIDQFGTDSRVRELQRELNAALDVIEHVRNLHKMLGPITQYTPPPAKALLEAYEKWERRETRSDKATGATQ